MKRRRRCIIFVATCCYHVGDFYSDNALWPWIGDIIRDFLIIRRDGSDYVVDILEPHDPTRQDNLGKAKGFAEYARQNPGIGRIQLIRMQRDSVGRERAFRLDMSKSSVRDKVSRCASNDELNHIFESEGFFQ